MTTPLPRLAEPIAQRLRDGDEPIVVTGASGWLGGATLRLLERALPPEQFESRVRAYASRTRGPLRALAALPGDGVGGALVLHFAFRTRGQGPDYERENAAIRALLLGAMADAAPAGLLLPSSGAVHAGGAYGEQKRLDEQIFSRACTAAAVPLVIARVFNVSGEGMTAPRDYALGSLVLDALAGEPLEVRARGPVRRSFVAAADLLSVGVAALTDPEVASPLLFEAVGEEVVEVGELAERVRAALGRADLEIRRPEFDPALPADQYVGDPVAWRELLARYGIEPLGLGEQIRQTAAALSPGR